MTTPKKHVYEVTVTQPLEKIHLVEARSLKEARQIIQDLIFDKNPEGVLESFAGDVGSERIVKVRREPK